MSRAQIITLSVVCCIFGGLALDGPDSVRGGAFAVNFVLVIVCIVVAGLDLTRRGWSLGYLFAAAYLVPFIGLIVYVGLCNRSIQEPAIAPSSDLVRHGAAVLDPYPSEVASAQRPRLPTGTRDDDPSDARARHHDEGVGAADSQPRAVELA